MNVDINKIRCEVNKFANSHKDFDTLVPKIIGLIQSGESLENSYEKAKLLEQEN